MSHADFARDFTHAPPLVTSRDGAQLLALLAPSLSGGEPARLPAHPDLPLSFACVVAWHQPAEGSPRVLWVFNPWREEWELPAGRIEPGEAPAEAAARELWEESGQRAALSYAGLCLLRIRHGAQLELGALYRGIVTQPLPFRPNNEADALLWWDGAAAVEGHLNDLGRAIMAWCGP